MKYLSAIIPFLAIATSCGPNLAIAELRLSNITQDAYSHTVEFNSDVQFFEIFSSNKNKKIVFSELICSLDDDTNFDIEHYFKRYANGSIDFLKTKTDVTSKNIYTFSSQIYFWESPADGMGTNRMIRKNELKNLLKDKISIPCKVRMTIYLSSPYYSKTMNIPTKNILHAQSNLNGQ